MDMTQKFLMWCTIINGGLLILSFLIFAFAGNLVYKFHGKFFQMPRETFNAVIYSLMGFHKIIFIVFNLIPFVAIAIIR